MTGFPLAASGTQGTFTPDQMWAGEDDIVTEAVTVLTGENLAAGTVIAYDESADKIVHHDPTAVKDIDASGDTVNVAKRQAKAIGVLLYAVDATSADKPGIIATDGYFNHAKLVWHASLTTLASRQAAFAGTSIHVRDLGA